MQKRGNRCSLILETVARWRFPPEELGNKKLRARRVWSSHQERKIHLRPFWKPLHPSCPACLQGCLPSALGAQDRGEGLSCDSPQLRANGPRPPARPPRPHLFNMGRNVLLYVIFLQRLSRTLHRILLHLLRHIGVFDHGLSVAHGYLGGEARASGEELGCRLRLQGASSPSPLLPPPTPLLPPPTPLLRKRGPRGPNSGRSPAGDVTRQRSPPQPPSLSPRSRGRPTATVSWGRGWRHSDPAGATVATEAVAHLRSPTPAAAA